MSVFEATKQYNHLLTYKYNVPYTWFQPNAVSSIDKLLFDIPQKHFPAFIQIFLFESFGGGGITQADLTVKTERDGVIDTASTLFFADFDLTEPISNYSGYQKPIPLRLSSPTPVSMPVALPRSKSANIYLGLAVNASKTIDDLTTGSFSLWFTFFKNI